MNRYPYQTLEGATILAKKGNIKALSFIVEMFLDADSTLMDDILNRLEDQFHDNDYLILLLSDWLKISKDNDEFDELSIAIFCIDTNGKYLMETIAPYLIDDNAHKRQHIAFLIIEDYLDNIDLDTVSKIEKLYATQEAYTVIEAWLKYHT